jgi:phosphatidylethanolamine-binding protein (PEBP) family uncharacterized protein
MYEFTLYALDVATLPDVTAASDGEAIEAQVVDHALESTVLHTFSVP